MEHVLRTKNKKDLKTLITLAKANGISVEEESQNAKRFKKELKESLAEFNEAKRTEKPMQSLREFIEELKNEC